MTFIPFQLEKWQSDYEQSVALNLADSGVHPVDLRELLTTTESVDKLLATALHYPPVNGSRRLREIIASLYVGAIADNVLVTVGAAEANAIILQTLLAPGDHVVAMEPSYRQLWGITRNLDCRVSAFTLDQNADWRANLDELESVVTPDTRLIGVTNPNNPTGKILTEKEMDRIVRVAEGCGAWILADEVYRGTERLTDSETPSFYGRYDRVIAVNSLSKAYGLSGLRLGWVVATPPLIDSMWRRHEYAVISTSVLSVNLAELALVEPVRSALLERTRRFIREGYKTIEHWISQHPNLVSLIPPESTALAFVRYHFDKPSSEVADVLRRDASVLVAPGDCFGIEHHLRITTGLKQEYLLDALRRIAVTFEQLA